MPASPLNHRYALPFMLFMLGVAILIFILALAGYLDNQAAVIDAPGLIGTASITPSPLGDIASPSNSPAYQRPSWTPPATPTIPQTQTITPTSPSTIIPSLTPANPQPFDNRYNLADWNLAEADRMIQLLTVQADSRNDPEWYSAAAYAQQEALLRFPLAFDASSWRWQRAYNLIQAGDSQAGGVYTELIEGALASGEVSSDALADWFQGYEPELTLTVTHLPAQVGELNRLLIQISGAGNAFIWLVETPISVDAYLLLSDFDPNNKPQMASQSADLTGDGVAELMIYHTITPGRTTFPAPWIFDLTHTPPVLMPVHSGLPLELGTESENLLNIVPAAHGGNDLQLTSRLFPACPVEFTRSFHWDGEKFAISPALVTIQAEPALLAWCEMVIDHATLEWAPEYTLAVAEPLLASWPPPQDILGDSYPADALDGWRFRLGILHALTGDSAGASQMMETILDNPASPQSTWIERARLFLDQYQDPADIYITCQSSPRCNLQYALQTLARYSGLSDPSLVLAYLQQHGVATRAAGYFDFNNDGNDEQWVSILPQPGGKLEFWILNATRLGVQAIFVQIIEDNNPQPYYHDLAETPLVIQLERGRGFIIEYDHDSGEAAIHFVHVEYSRPTIIMDGLDQAAEALYLGTDPGKVLVNMIEIRSSPRFTGDCSAFGICARYYYTLGLAYELEGDELNAISNYLYVWRLYPYSPYTLMARMKLYLIPATPTITPTNTRTATVTMTPDPNRTATHTTLPYNVLVDTATPVPYGGPVNTPTATNNPYAVP